MIAKRSFLLALGAAPFLASPLARAAAAYDGSRRTLSWSAWRGFAAEAVSDEGRLIDSSDARLITTSEGQSYGLFFALVDDDRELYEKLRRWTVDNLCAGDIGKNLPAWLWGRNEESAPKTNDLSRGAKAPAPAPVERWGVIDENNATDADLWIAYALLEAGRLWKADAYREEGLALLYGVALIFVPCGDCALGHGEAELGHYYFLHVGLLTRAAARGSPSAP